MDENGPFAPFNEYGKTKLEAEAIYRSLEMTRPEQAERMRRMRDNVRERNVYRWAANLLSDLTDIRIDAPERVEVQ